MKNEAKDGRLTMSSTMRTMKSALSLVCCVLYSTWAGLVIAKPPSWDTVKIGPSRFKVLSAFNSIAVLWTMALILASTADAGTTIASGGLKFNISPGSDSRLECTVTNVGSKPITLETEPQIFGAQSDNATEQITGTTCGILAPLAPGSSCYSSLPAFAATCSDCYCKVTFTGSRKGVRGIFSIYSSTTGNDLVAVPLQ